MNRLLLTALASAVLLSACSDEPEIVVVEPVEKDEVAYLAEDQPLTWDSDGDALFSESEYLAFGNSAWGRWDADREGTLSREEFERGWTQAGFTDPGAAFIRFDSDNDGLLQQREFFAADAWGGWDADDSGVLERTEFAYY